MVKNKIKIPKNTIHSNSRFIAEKSRIEKNFPCFQCRVKRGRLSCRGTICPSEGSDTYSVKLVYKQGGIPRVYITHPKIDNKTECHVYKDGSLCLYDHREFSWSGRLFVHETIVPWAAEWLVFYELWKITGKWLGPEAPHGTSAKVPEARKVDNF